MLHACFVYIPTCFMCTFIHFLAFLGTNLLTRCHSVSSCFLLFLCIRKVVQEIFSELHGTKTQRLTSPKFLLMPSQSHSQKGPEGGAQGGQTTPRHGPRSGRAGGVSGPPW